MTFDLGLQGKTVVVVGGGSGIGRAVALAAAEQRAKVGLVDWNLESADGVRDEILAAGQTALSWHADVRAPDTIEAAFSAVESRLGEIDGVVVCAGTTNHVPAVEMTVEQWRGVVDVNLMGTFLTSQAVGRRFVARGTGSLVLIGSVLGEGGHVDRAHYVSSKYGVHGLTRSLATEWGRSNVRVNAVAPGIVDTPLVRGLHTEEGIRASPMMSRVPLGRMSRPEDQANAVMFLLSDAAAYVSGVVLPVDGGLTAGHLAIFGPEA